MKVAVGADHGGLDLKKVIVELLSADSIEVIDVGTNSPASVDYPDYAEKVAKLVIGKEVDFGILVCGTGIGMCIAANKFPGIRAALAWDIFTARMARRHNNANILTIGGRVTGPELAKEIVRTFIREPYDGGRHEARIEKISKIEREPRR
jgi:ribose 5-phosphate isomerase B